MNGDLERVGDLAVSIGKAGRRYLRHPPVKRCSTCRAWASSPPKMRRESIEALVKTDVGLAKNVLIFIVEARDVRTGRRTWRSSSADETAAFLLSRRSGRRPVDAGVALSPESPDSRWRNLRNVWVNLAPGTACGSRSGDS